MEGTFTKDTSRDSVASWIAELSGIVPSEILVKLSKDPRSTSATSPLRCINRIRMPGYDEASMSWSRCNSK
jgi:hypothetical protein